MRHIGCGWIMYNDYGKAQNRHCTGFVTKREIDVNHISDEWIQSGEIDHMDLI